MTLLKFSKALFFFAEIKHSYWLYVITAILTYLSASFEHASQAMLQFAYDVIHESTCYDKDELTKPKLVKF